MWHTISNGGGKCDFKEDVDFPNEPKDNVEIVFIYFSECYNYNIPLSESFKSSQHQN